VYQFLHFDVISTSSSHITPLHTTTQQPDMNYFFSTLFKEEEGPDRLAEKVKND
jgi:hypothetical protein